MVFNSFLFFLFFLVVFLVYWKLPKNVQKYRWVVLLAASYYFYISWQPAYLALIFLTTVVNYFAAIQIEKSPKKRLLTFALCLLFDFGLLFLFKYLNFFSISLDTLFSTAHISASLPQFKLLLPIGISFYTFQTVGYMVDVYKGKIKAEKHFGFFALFVSFFPQLVAGPIARSTSLLPQFRQKKTFDYSRTVSGLQLFTMGLFKKLVIADNLGIAVDKVFTSLPQYKGLSLVFAVFFFSWQIYADFSGYTDMARGVARMLRFELLENFKTPYLATSLRDFWGRWHISLSTWLKDYLYIPLGGNRGGIWKTCLNTFIVFFVCGLWHGASWHFALWGVFHGFFLAIERVYQHFHKQKWHFTFRIPPLLAGFYTYCIVSASWVLFRANTLTDALYIYKYLFAGAKHFISPTYIWASLSQMFLTNVVEIAIALFCVLAMISIDVISSRMSIAKLIRQQQLVVRWAIYIGVVSLIVFLRNAAVTQFIYVQF